MRAGTLLRGATAIGEHLGVSAAEASRLHHIGAIPTFRAGGTPYATKGALAEWQALQHAGRLPKQ